MWRDEETSATRAEARCAHAASPGAAQQQCFASPFLATAEQGIRNRIGGNEKKAWKLYLVGATGALIDAPSLEGCGPEDLAKLAA